MGQNAVSLLISGFTFFEVLLILAASIVAALVVRRWSQLAAAVFGAYSADVAIRFVMEFMSAGDMPANFALELAFARLDMHGLAATVRPFLYFGLIALLFGLKHRYGAK
jgi:hypothetical protein